MFKSWMLCFSRLRSWLWSLTVLPGALRHVISIRITMHVRLASVVGRACVAEDCAQLVRARHVTKFVPCMLLLLSPELLLLLPAPLPLPLLLLRLPPCERC